MNLKTVQLTICATLSLTWLALCPSAIAGGNTIGNGGGSWVCRELSGTIRWSKLVDLFEETDEFGLTPKHYSGMTRIEIVDQVQNRIAQADRDLADAISPILRDLNYLRANPPAVTYTSHLLQTIDDSLYRIKPSQSDCVGGAVAYEQVVNYKNDGLILVDTELYNSFDLNTQAALILHEAIYKYRRDVKLDSDSVITRRIVGLIFSNLSTEDLKKELATLGEKENGELGLKFSQLQPGTFMMGSAPGTWANKNQHSVTITHPFEIQTTTVTQSQYTKLIGYNPSFFNKPEDCESTYEVRDHVAMCPNNPVENISYDDALAFIAKLNDTQGGKYLYRLPTEAEWEYALRGGTTTLYYFGNDFYGKDKNLFDDYGWFDANAKFHTHEVAQKTPNPFGLYDMLGNVAQWTSDWYGDYSKDPATDPTGPSSGMARVARPGGCGSTGVMDFSFINQYSAFRGYMFPQTHVSCMGFRLVRVRKN